jgi:hypothetical protein
MGDYYQMIGTTLLTQESQRTDAPSSDIALLRGKRFVSMSETQDGVSLNAATLKYHSGEKTICFRLPHAKFIETTAITWTLFLMTNDKQRINSGDQGVLRRTAYIPFKAKFVDRQSEILTDLPNGQKYYLKDGDVANLVNDCRLEFFHLLKRNCNPNDDLELTGEIKRETEELIQSADSLHDMLLETFERAEDPEYGISWEDMKVELKVRHGHRYEEILKKCGATQLLLDKIAMRLPYATQHGKPQGTAIKYRNAEGNWAKSRRVFKGIRVIRDTDETEPVCQV